jgi:4,5:9,10-diseco-3-hydroxy-5,9,17-trioxoandrosta-1(10),2-diene-4-oate hydrolase
MPDSADLSPEFYGRFLRNFLAAVGIERTSLVGHSLGGGIALRFCQDNPKQVDRLILASSAGLGQEISLPLRIASLPFMEYVIMKPTFPVFRLILHRLVFDPASITDEFARVYYGLLFQPGTLRALTGILRAVCTIGGARPGIVEPIRKRLGTITAPTLVLWGRQDRILPVRHGIDAAEKIPGARLHIFEHCGHMPNIEYPEEFNRLLVEFLDEGRGTRGEGRE